MLYLEQIHFILVSARLIYFGQMESLFSHSWSLKLCWVTFLNLNFRGCFLLLTKISIVFIIIPDDTDLGLCSDLKI